MNYPVTFIMALVISVCLFSIIERRQQRRAWKDVHEHLKSGPRLNNAEAELIKCLKLLNRARTDCVEDAPGQYDWVLFSECQPPIDIALLCKSPTGTSIHPTDVRAAMLRMNGTKPVLFDLDGMLYPTGRVKPPTHWRLLPEAWEDRVQDDSLKRAREDCDENAPGQSDWVLFSEHQPPVDIALLCKYQTGYRAHPTNIRAGMIRTHTGQPALYDLDGLQFSRTLGLFRVPRPTHWRLLPEAWEDPV